MKKKVENHTRGPEGQHLTGRRDYFKLVLMQILSVRNHFPRDTARGRRKKRGRVFPRIRGLLSNDKMSPKSCKIKFTPFMSRHFNTFFGFVDDFRLNKFKKLQTRADNEQ